MESCLNGFLPECKRSKQVLHDERSALTAETVSGIFSAWSAAQAQGLGHRLGHGGRLLGLQILPADDLLHAGHLLVAKQQGQACVLVQLVLGVVLAVLANIIA
jgi:hypothetical protein